MSWKQFIVPTIENGRNCVFGCVLVFFFFFPLKINALGLVIYHIKKFSQCREKLADIFYF